MKGSGTEGGASRSPTDIDRIVGGNVRRLRIQRHLTLAHLAAELGLSHQQLQKYETGANRLSAGVLARVAGALDVPIESLFARPDARAQKGAGAKSAEMAALLSEGQFLLGRARTEARLRQMVDVLKALSSDP